MTSDAAPGSSAIVEQFLLGARACIPIYISVAAYGIVWGVLARQAGMTLPEVILMSGLVFAGASQFVAVDLWVPGSLPVGALILAALIVNLRFVLVTATLRPLFRGVSLWRSVPSMFFVSDENWAITMAEVARGRGSAAFLLGGGVALWLTWLASTIAGRLVGSLIDDPVKYGLDFAFTATFLALLLGMWRGRGDLVPWFAGGAVAILTSWVVPGSWHILIGGLLGSFAGALFEHWRGTRAA